MSSSASVAPLRLDPSSSSKRQKILVVEDDERVRNALVNLLTEWGYTVETASDGTEAWDKIVSISPAVVLSDLQMPGLSGLDLLKQTREFDPGVYFVMLSGHGTIQYALEATRLGAFDFLEKPADPAHLQITLRNCLERHESERQLQIAHRKLRDLGALGRLVGRSRKMKQIMALTASVAPSAASVLITGESGTGKEVVARTIHDLSPYRSNSFVAVNCAAIPESLIESELFGHEKGAFTGAVQACMGCFELAQGGTLLLDEIGEMPLAAQAKLLRVLEDSKVRRLGAKSEIKVSVRVLASTNRVPEDAVKAGLLRSDLYYRLNVVQIAMPPLRERLEDLDVLATSLVEDLCQKHRQPLKSLDHETLRLMHCHPWPGNVRELRNVLERAIVTCPGSVIMPENLPRTLLGDRNGFASPKIEVGLTLADAERRLILQTLSSTANNKARAADILGIALKTLDNKLKEYGADPA
jgi:DNA-binding NtrC family response regulator